jgi:hypothetical protein
MITMVQSLIRASAFFQVLGSCECMNYWYNNSDLDPLDQTLFNNPFLFTNLITTFVASYPGLVLFLLFFSISSSTLPPHSLSGPSQLFMFEILVRA